MEAPALSASADDRAIAAGRQPPPGRSGAAREHTATGGTLPTKKDEEGTEPVRRRWMSSDASGRQTLRNGTVDQKRGTAGSMPVDRLEDMLIALPRDSGNCSRALRWMFNGDHAERAPAGGGLRSARLKPAGDRATPVGGRADDFGSTTSTSTTTRIGRLIPDYEREAIRRMCWVDSAIC